MFKKLANFVGAFALLSGSAVAWASTQCCGDLHCCLERLAACCF